MNRIFIRISCLSIVLLFAGDGCAQIEETAPGVWRPGIVYGPAPIEPELPELELRDPIAPCDLSPSERGDWRIRPALNLERRLENCPRLRDGIVWQEPGGETIRYADWPSEKKGRLNHFFQAMMRGDYALNTQCPDPREALQPPFYYIYYSYDEAFDVFAAYVAHVLYLEAEDLVPWKVNDMPRAEAGQLLNSETFFSVIKPSAKTDYPPHITAGEDYQAVGWSQPYGPLLCDPRQGFKDFHIAPDGAPYVSGNSVVGPDMETTLANLTLWVRDHVTHGVQSLHLYPQHWIFASQTVGQRVRPFLTGKIEAHGGCHGAAGTLREVARSLNIPLLLIASGDTPKRSGLTLASRTHKGLCARWTGSENRCLWHLDEVYAYSPDEPTFPVDLERRPVTGQSLALEYFLIHWRSMSVLEDWGFEVYLNSAIPNPDPDHDFYTGKGAAEEYYTYGTYLGHWRLSDRAMDKWELDGGAEFKSEYGDLLMNFRFNNLIQSRSWFLLDGACEGSSRVLQERVLRIDGQSSLYPPPNEFPESAINYYIEQTMEAYGDQFGYYGQFPTDCSNVKDIRDAWLQAR